jgi:hypothetical protein
LLESEVEQFLTFEQRTARAASPRKTKYDWPAFKAEAARRLDDEGDYHENWSQADLEREMIEWCGHEARWEKTPVESEIRRHITLARAIFLAQRAAI